MKLLIFLYLMFLSGTDIFRFYEWLPLYQYFLIPIILLAIFKGVRFIDYKPDIFLLVMLAILIFSSLVNWNIKSLNYIMAYLYVIFGMYFLFKSALITSNINFNSLLKANFYGVMLLSTYIICEILFKFFFDFDITIFLHRTRETTALFSPYIYRAYGFSTEPTATAWYLNSFGPLAIYFLINKFKAFMTKYLMILIIIIAFIFTFSSAALLFLFLGLIFIIIKYNLYRKFFGNIFFFHFVLFLFLIVFIEPIHDAIYYYFEGIIHKITLNNEYKSVVQRLIGVETALTRFSQSPIIGSGLGLTSSLGEMSPMSWYLILITNGGLLAFLSLFIFLAIKFYEVLVIKESIGIFMTFSLLVTFLSLSTTAAFFNPFLWTLLAIIGAYKYSKKRKISAL